MSSRLQGENPGVRECECVCGSENLNLPVNEYVAHVCQIAIVSRKISVTVTGICWGGGGDGGNH